jgi:hypothetical protein
MSVASGFIGTIRASARIQFVGRAAKACPPFRCVRGGHVAEPVLGRRGAPIRVLLCPAYNTIITRAG